MDNKHQDGDVAIKIARELDRRALLTDSRGDRPLTDSELEPVISVIAGALPQKGGNK